MAEWSHLYGGPPPRDLPHPLFFGLARKAGRFIAREVANVMAGIGYAFGEGTSGQVERRRLLDMAYTGNGQKAKPRALIKQSDREDIAGPEDA